MSVNPIRRRMDWLPDGPERRPPLLLHRSRSRTSEQSAPRTAPSIRSLAVILLACAIGCRGGLEGESVERLRAMLSGDAADKVRAAQALARRGADAAPATEDLARLFSEPDERTRIAAAVALARIGPGAAPAVPTLLEGLQDRAMVLRLQSARALEAIGSRDPAVRAALERACKDESPAVRDAARDALDRWKADPSAGAVR